MTFDVSSCLPPANVRKRRLINTVMYVQRVQKEITCIFPHLLWRIENFPKYRKPAVFTYKVKELGWDLKLTKKRNSVTITCNTNDWGKCLSPACAVIYDAMNHSAPYYINQVSKGVYEVNIPPHELIYERNWNLQHQGRFEIQFWFEERRRNNFNPDSSREDYSSRMAPFVQSMKPMFRRMTDFTIRAEGNSVGCHKALLARRSSFFFYYFQEPCNNQHEITLEVTYETLSRVVSYLYSGEFPTKDLAEVIDIVNLSSQLEIPSIMVACETYISQAVNADNVQLIREEGIKFGISFMVGAANVFLRNIGKDVP